MDKISAEQEAVLEVLDAQIEKLEKKLAKAQPLINRLQQLKQTRRVLLSEKGTTGGGGRSDVQLTQEQVIHFLRENGASQPQEIANALGVAGTVVRSHLHRHKDETYENTDDGWVYIGANGDEEDDE